MHLLGTYCVSGIRPDMWQVREVDQKHSGIASSWPTVPVTITLIPPEEAELFGGHGFY